MSISSEIHIYKDMFTAKVREFKYFINIECASPRFTIFSTNITHFNWADVMQVNLFAYANISRTTTINDPDIQLSRYAKSTICKMFIFLVRRSCLMSLLQANGEPMCLCEFRQKFICTTIYCIEVMVLFNWKWLYFTQFSYISMKLNRNCFRATYLIRFFFMFQFGLWALLQKQDKFQSKDWCV